MQTTPVIKDRLSVSQTITHSLKSFCHTIQETLIKVVRFVCDFFVPYSSIYEKNCCFDESLLQENSCLVDQGHQLQKKIINMRSVIKNQAETIITLSHACDTLNNKVKEKESAINRRDNILYDVNINLHCMNWNLKDRAQSQEYTNSIVPLLRLLSNTYSQIMEDIQTNHPLNTSKNKNLRAQNKELVSQIKTISRKNQALKEEIQSFHAKLPCGDDQLATLLEEVDALIYEE